MKIKHLIPLLIIALIIGTVNGLLVIEEVQYFIYSYPLSLIITLIIIKLKFKCEGIAKYAFPLFTIMLYISTNILAGMTFRNGVHYYSSFPRYELIFYYFIILFSIYAFANLIVSSFNIKEIKVVFTIVDVLSFLILPVALAYTYFVSPH